jgi:hypothetical protein
MIRVTILLILVLLTAASSCSKKTSDGYTAVKPRYHHTWYKNHIYKKKWHIGRIQIKPEKQGTKKVTMGR